MRFDYNERKHFQSTSGLARQRSCFIARCIFEHASACFFCIWNFLCEVCMFALIPVLNFFPQSRALHVRFTARLLVGLIVSVYICQPVMGWPGGTPPSSQWQLWLAPATLDNYLNKHYRLCMDVWKQYMITWNRNYTIVQHMHGQNVT